MVLVLPHGIAKAERGFSVNKHVLQDNMKERWMVAQRVVNLAISKAGKFTNIDIDKQMLGDGKTGLTEAKAIFGISKAAED